MHYMGLIQLLVYRAFPSTFPTLSTRLLTIQCKIIGVPKEVLAGCPIGDLTPNASL